MPYGAPGGLFRLFSDPTDNQNNVGGPNSAGENYFGSRGFFAGVDAGANAGTDPTNQLENLILIGDGAGENAQGDEFIGIGVNVIPNLVDDADRVIAIGHRIIPGATTVGRSIERLSDSVFIGDDILSLLENPGNSGFDAPMVMIGADIMANFVGANNQNIPGNVLIGTGVLEENTGTFGGAILGNVLIGHHVGKRIQGAITASVGIGYHALRGISPAGSGNSSLNVAIGAGTLKNIQSAASNNVAVGSGAINSSTGAVSDSTLGALTTGSNNVAIGRQAGTDLTTPDGNVLIGFTVAENASDYNVVIGANGGDGMNSGSASNVIIGRFAADATVTGDFNVILGAGAGSDGLPSPYDHRLVIETRATSFGSGNHARSLIYGRFDLGSLVFGSTVDGNGDPINRDVNDGGTGTNLVKILDGTAPDGNPAGGGFLYSTAGALFWRGSGGTITAIAPA